MGIKEFKDLTKATKIFFLILFTIILFIILKIISGHFLPRPEDGVWFQFGLLLVVLGSFFIEPHFSKPTDVIANSIAVLVTLLAVVNRSEFIIWTVMFIISVVLLILSIFSIALSSPELSERSIRFRLSKFAYNISTFFGSGRLLFSIIFILAVASYFSTLSKEFMYLMFFWGFIIIVGPSGLATFVDRIFILLRGKQVNIIGTAIGIIHPNIVLAKLTREGEGITCLHPVLIHMTELGGKGKVGLILGDYVLEDEKWIRILLIEDSNIELPKDIITDEKSIYFKKGSISLVSEEKLPNSVTESFIWKNKENIVGFVEENSNIGKIVFEVFPNPAISLEEGHLLKLKTRGKDVYYQIIEGITESEGLQKKNRSGFIRGIAQQLGTWNEKSCGFDRFGWVPKLNSPIYIIKEDEKIQYIQKEGEFILGNIPRSKFPVVYNMSELIKYHTAILGITGCGKSWLAYSLIEELAKLKVKTICMDFTGDYKKDLEPLKPNPLISEEDVTAINTKLEEAQEIKQDARGRKTPEYKAKIEEVQSDLDEIVGRFMGSRNFVANFELPDISNTFNILEFTQMFLQSIFNYAKANRGKHNICIVLEEAHTVIPEPATFTGVWGDYGESKQVVGKISQIALQGRKYNVGFLVIAQRTANVTKTVLNQCNSVIAFNAFDETGMNFLKNYLGEDMVKVIPNLKEFQAVTVGKAFKSKNPLIVQIPIREETISLEDKRQEVKSEGESEDKKAGEDRKSI